MILTLSNRLTVEGAPPELARDLCERLTLPNPEHAAAARAGRYAGHLDPTVRYFRQVGEALEVPRGAVGLVRWLAKQHGARVDVVDRTRVLPPVAFDFRAELRPYQVEALEQVTRWPGAVLQAPTGAGKTVVGLAAIAARRQPALVVAHNATLAEQWIERAGRFLGLEPGEVGRVGGGKLQVGARLTVGVINTVAKHAAELAPLVGHLVVDECHRVVALRYARAVGAFDARFVLGLSATPWRRDGLSPAVGWILGKPHRIDKAPLVEAGAVLEADVVRQETRFTTDLDASAQYQAVLTELTESLERNRQIAGDVARALAEDPAAVALVLSDRRAHCDTLQAELARLGVGAVVLTGQVAADARDAALAQVDGVRVRCIVGTAQLIGEGWDFPQVGTLFLATPIKFDGRLIQVVGRVLRPAPGKARARVVDYVDARVPVLRASAESRRRTYRREAVG